MQIKIYEQDNGFLISVDNIEDCKAVVKTALTALTKTEPVQLTNLNKIDTADFLPTIDESKRVTVEDKNKEALILNKAIRFISSPAKRTGADKLSNLYGYSNLDDLLKANKANEIMEIYKILIIKSI